MDNYGIYQDIATRTNGDIYIGVVGPVRTGKSTFIKNFMNMAVLPNISNEYKRERAKDELPQSSNGRMIMTTEPKFVPNEAVEVLLDNVRFNMRMIDCVGYLVNNALGHIEGNVPRMVNTPWSEKQIPFEEAAEIGTRKVIEEHSTIGILVTTDGSVTELSREDYINAEERVADELKKKNKPYIVILNTSNPTSENSIKLCKELEEKYDAPVMPLDCAHMNENNISEIMSRLLYEFPVNEIDIMLPKWVEELDKEHPLKTNLIKMFREKFASIKNLRQIKNIGSEMETEEIIDRIRFDAIELGAGKTSANVEIDKKLFYEILSEMSGVSVKEEGDLFSIVTSLAQKKKSYDKIEMALNDVKRKGYGIVTPDIDDLTLEEPEIVKQGSKFGVRLRAKAPSLHIVKADIETEVSPVVGSEKQSEELINYLMKEFEDDPKQIWNSNIFGKSLHELVNEGLQTKLHKMPEDAQCKLQETLEKIINEGSGGLICIIL
ncbi:MAG: stage IV sporulation protein A [Clostridia bacterium]|nr:stage IV sporulation protein A [Clostridia bacterium]